MSVRGPTPTFAPISDVKGYVSVPWQQWFSQLNTATFPDGVTGVVDGSLPITGNPTTIFQDLLQNQPEAEKQYLFFSLDTGGVYTVNAAGEWQLQSPALLGDVTKPAFSQITVLSETGVVPGTYTSATVTVDAKGRITAIESGTFAWPVTDIGDLIVGTGYGTVTNLPYGNPGDVLTVVEDDPLKVAWAPASTGSEAIFNYTDTTKTIAAIESKYIVERVEVLIHEPFEPSTTISVGNDLDNELLMPAVYIDPTVIGNYELFISNIAVTSYTAKVYITTAGLTGLGTSRITISAKRVPEIDI
jgi:hypothetical protein